MTVIVTMIPAEFVLNPAGMYNTLKSPTGMVGKSLIRRATRVELAAQQQAKSIGRGDRPRTGDLSRSVHKRIVPNGPGGGMSVLVGSDQPYALFVHQGTRAHVIKPRTAKFLVFYMDGRKVVTKRVQHPGGRPNKFLTDNLHLAIV